MSEASWKRLINKIREGNVVPIVGPRLLVNANGQSIQAQIASRLIESNGMEVGDIALPPFCELNEAVSRLKGNVREQDLYDSVSEAIDAVVRAPDFVIPPPIRRLAQISGFRLFVTLTPDGLLAQSLRQRCTVNEIIHSLKLSASEGTDLPRDWKARPGEVYVLYLFGKSCSSPSFAIHDEDVLEYAHNVIARGSQVPSIFLDELKGRNLLLVGCNFPDWLQRFFLRATNQTRLSKEDRRAWLIEPLGPEESLTCFLRSYSKETEILSQTAPAEFVTQLHQRWMAELGGGSAQDSSTDEDVVPDGVLFFISYSRQTDRLHAESLYRALIKLGVTENEVWFDRKSIDPGQDYKRGIFDGIRNCKYFLPLLSKACDAREEGFVFTEWDEANKRLSAMNREFVFPVVVDAEFKPECYRAKPAARWSDDHLDFAYAPDGTPDDRFEAKLKKLLRDARRAAGAP
jgi:hypothetical protein